MENETTQFKFRASKEFIANLDHFWRHLRSKNPEKYADVNNKGQFVIACILNDMMSTETGQRLLKMQASHIPEMEWWLNAQESFEDALEKFKNKTEEHLKGRMKK